MAILDAKDSKFYIRENRIEIHTPSTVAIGIDNSIYINVDIEKVATKEVRYQYKGTFSIAENVDFDTLNVKKSHFVFEHKVSSKNININIKDSEIAYIKFNGAVKGMSICDISQDLVNLNIENSSLLFNIYIHSKKININTKNLKDAASIYKDNAGGMMGYIFYNTDKIEVNTNSQKNDCIEPYIECLRSNQDYYQSKIEDTLKELKESEESLTRIKSDIKDIEEKSKNIQ